MHDLDAARKHAKWDADAAAIAWAQDRIEDLEAALQRLDDLGIREDRVAYVAIQAWEEAMKLLPKPHRLG